MKPYACQPVVRARFQPPVSAFVTRPYSNQWPANKTTEQRSTRPAANIVRHENGYEIQLAVPGVSKSQIKIEVVQDQLIISATNPNQDGQTKFVRHEFEYNTFSRRFNLPKNADTANLKAAFEQGILSIVIPDREPQTRKIEII